MIRREQLRRIVPNVLASYLQGRGYSRVAIGRYSSVWRRDDTELTVPITMELDDYDSMVRSVILGLEQSERLTNDEIIHALSFVAYDIVELANIDGIDEWAHIPLTMAPDAVESMQRLALGVAYSTATKFKRATVPSKRPPDVNEFLGSMKFGVLRNGRSALALFAPIPLTTQESLWQQGKKVPFEREVMLQIPRAIAAVAEASIQAKATGNLDRFTQAVEEGGSVPVLRALKQFHKFTSSDSKLHVLYSPMVGGEAREDTAAVPSHEMIDILTDAIAYLEERDPVEVDEIEGPIIELGRAYDSVQGAVLMIAVVNGKPQRVYMHLSNEDYNIAWLAHGQKASAKAAGVLRKDRSNRWWLENPQNVQIALNPEQGLDLT